MTNDFFFDTAITYSTKDHYFGRNLDLEFSYNETAIDMHKENLDGETLSIYPLVKDAQILEGN